MGINVINQVIEVKMEKAKSVDELPNKSVDVHEISYKMTSSFIINFSPPQVAAQSNYPSLNTSLFFISDHY